MILRYLDELSPVRSEWLPQLSSELSRMRCWQVRVRRRNNWCRFSSTWYKSAHFLEMQETLPLDKLAKLYINEVVRRHGVPLSIFWHGLQEGLGTKLKLSTAYHPQTDGQSERTIQTLEDMLRSCIIDFGGNWDTHLPLVEFVSNCVHKLTNQ
ncbi:hypothetical protein OSB04_031791 [Centaurea solstitialis]|uniref:Integrase catalytic domain-containing protein n=1 Tax=Centaurea solstitialis TaxID=347529 RepID=A0AA38SHP8_9ASTR|nr:hypothetical protein OSB04_031791 [Centaurea solstitialis]